MPTHVTKAVPIFATILAAATAGCMALTAGAVHAAQGKVVSTIPVSFAGIPVGTMRNTYAIDGGSYSVTGQAKANRAVSLLTSSGANWKAAGRVRGGRLVPDAHASSYKSPKGKGAVSVAFSGGNATQVSVAPKRKVKPGTVALTAAHRKQVVDPVTALMVAVEDSDIGDGAKICGQTLPVFDGRTRYDLALGFKSKQNERVEGFDGETFTCAVRFKPVAGHRPKKKNVRALAANRNITVTLARIGKTNVYGVFGFNVPTASGTARGTASAFVSR